ALGIEQKVVSVGVRPDVAKFMGAVVDVLLFPSRFEGAGLVLVEAQAAGLPIVASDRVPEEVRLCPLMRTMSLSESNDKWVDAIIEVAERYPLLSRTPNCVHDWAFEIGNSAARLMEFYEAVVAAVRIKGPHRAKRGLS